MSQFFWLSKSGEAGNRLRRELVCDCAMTPHQVCGVRRLRPKGKPTPHGARRGVSPTRRITAHGAFQPIIATLKGGGGSSCWKAELREAAR